MGVCCSPLESFYLLIRAKGSGKRGAGPMGSDLIGLQICAHVLVKWEVS